MADGDSPASAGGASRPGTRTGMSNDTALSLARDGSALRVRATGEWVATEAHRLEPLAGTVADKAAGFSSIEFDLTGVTRLDTLGAMLIDQARQSLSERGATVEVKTGSDAQRILLDEVAANVHAPLKPRPHGNSFVELLADIGMVMRNVVGDIVEMNAFLGEL